MAVLLVVVLAPRPPAPLPSEDVPKPYVGPKGEPVVVVHVRHGEHVSRWDGTQPLLPGDRVRLEVAASGYSRVLVGSPTPDGGFVTLYTGALPEGGALLPASWQVDAEGSGEHLVVVLSRAALAPEVLRRVLAERGGPDVWVTDLRLPKQTAP
ncbi:hypothetical protein HPC49_38895, partial [Pyxidicoccus fallax]